MLVLLLFLVAILFPFGFGITFWTLVSLMVMIGQQAGGIF